MIPGLDYAEQIADMIDEAEFLCGRSLEEECPICDEDDEQGEYMFYEEKIINGITCCRRSPNGEWEPVSRETLESRLAEAIQSAPAAANAGEQRKETDMSKRLREKASQPFGPEDFELLIQAADEIERYYGGMLAWKQTAEAKDRPTATSAAATPQDARGDLQMRCAEILNWHRTGVLTGNALRSYAAAKPYANDDNSLRIAESDTAREAFALIAALSHQAQDAVDAARYRWLREHLIGADFDWNESGTTILAFEYPKGIDFSADCDANVDAAMQSASKGEAK